MKTSTRGAATLKTSLTRRYSLALLLLFAILLATFATFTRQASIAENDAFLVNISGMQRMLSQRVALMAKEIRQSKTQIEAQGYAEKLEASIFKMESNHRALSTGKLDKTRAYDLSPELAQAYFGDNGLDARVTAYLKAARAFLELYREQGLDVIKRAVNAEKNVAMARNGLLTDLNAAVLHYEQEAQGRVKTFAQLELGFFVLGLCILLGEVLFIFQPMVRMIVGKIARLETRNAELKAISVQLAKNQGLLDKAKKTKAPQRQANAAP